MAYSAVTRIVIIGGGFGGIRTALNLAEENDERLKITLISDNPHFEYHAALYRVVTGRSPQEVCIPLHEVFAGKNVEVVQDSIASLDLKKKIATGKTGTKYEADYLVLALGSETSYFGIEGLQEQAYGFKSIEEALTLKAHIHTKLEELAKIADPKARMPYHIVVVGGGASGTELASELAVYTKNLARMHKVLPTLITINLIEAGPRILPGLPEDISNEALKALHRLGVNVFLNEAIMKENFGKVTLKNMAMDTDTVIWTAGVMPNRLYKETKGFLYDKRGKVTVDSYLQPDGNKNIFVIGDAASTTYSGMAQTAIHDGKFVADVILARQDHEKSPRYVPQPPAYCIPLGPGKALFLKGGVRLYGSLGWLMRRYIDYKYFASILPPAQARLAFKSGETISETCPICTGHTKPAT